MKLTKRSNDGRWSPDQEQLTNCTVYDGWRKVKNYRRDDLGRFVRNDDRHAELRRHLFDCVICAVAGGLVILVLIQP